jgi:hypothetical protein
MKRLFLTVLLSLPLALPASAQKQQSDREAEGLKGAVKTVTTETSEPKRPSGKSGRKPMSTLTFDVDGNLALRKDYADRGEAAEFFTYSFLHGERVVSTEVVMRNDSIAVAPPAPAEESKRPSDQRYTYKLKYKYDDNGNRTEETWFYRDGSPYVRYVYKLKGNRKEELFYLEDGWLTKKFIYTLDGKGNEVEMIGYISVDGPIDQKVTYSYLEFDPQGNWIQRSESRGDEKSKFAPRPWRVTYRTITYH